MATQNFSLAAGATSASLTVTPNTIYGIETSLPVYVFASNGALIAEMGTKDAINIIPTNTPITIKAKDSNTATCTGTVVGA
jgi:hypothetical protein